MRAGEKPQLLDHAGSTRCLVSGEVQVNREKLDGSDATYCISR